jgi:hypothetical protein
MPTGPTGTPPHSPNATTRERTTIDELYRAGEHAGSEREAGAIRAGLALILELITTRHRRQTNGYFDDPGADD